MSTIFIAYNEETTFDSAAIVKRYNKMMKNVLKVPMGKTQHFGVACSGTKMEVSEEFEEEFLESKRERDDEQEEEERELGPRGFVKLHRSADGK